MTIALMRHPIALECAGHPDTCLGRVLMCFMEVWNRPKGLSRNLSYPHHATRRCWPTMKTSHVVHDHLCKCSFSNKPLFPCPFAGPSGLAGGVSPALPKSALLSTGIPTFSGPRPPVNPSPLLLSVVPSAYSISPYSSSSNAAVGSMYPALRVDLCLLLNERAMDWKEEWREWVLVKGTSFSSMEALCEVSASGWRRVVLVSL
jgi:hypothetical protein